MIIEDYIYECPKCKNEIAFTGCASGNSFEGVTIYSDGKREENMFYAPMITKCKKCNFIFWITDLKEKKRIEWSKLTEKDKTRDRAYPLSLAENFKALEKKIYKSVEEEIYIRESIWQNLNDYDRDESSFSYDINIYNENVKRLIKLIKIENTEDKIKLAELYRNIGNFEKCIELINSIEENDVLAWVKKLFTKECEKKNTKVFRLK